MPVYFQMILEWLKTLHSTHGISELIGLGGMIVITVIIWSETGLLLGFFLPGDSLLITAGVLANPHNPHHLPTLNIALLNIVLICAAIAGNQLGYYLGKRAGEFMWHKPDNRFYKKRYLKAAHDFYMQHGGIAIVGARYVPIMRTFVPFVAGMARMPYKKFVFWDIFGGVLWITSLLWLGYYLGQTSMANRLDKLIVIVIFISLLPMIMGATKKALSSKRQSK